MSGGGIMKITSTEAKNSLGKYLRLCTAEPVYITKNGAVIAKLMKAEANYSSEAVEDAIVTYEAKPIKMSYETFEKMNEESEIRYEYIDGQVYMLSSPGVRHQRLVSRLHVAFDRYLEDLPCDSFVAPFDIRLMNKKKDWNLVQPDLMILCNWEEDIDDRDHYRGIPTLVVEVLSPSNSRKEMMTKLNLYMVSGIKEYWIVDPLLKQIMVYAFMDQRVINTGIYTETETAYSFIYKNFSFTI